MFVATAVLVASGGEGHQLTLLPRAGGYGGAVRRSGHDLAVDEADQRSTEGMAFAADLDPAGGVERGLLRRR
ncbi:MAG: hypothetical protein DLM55_04560 [Acidimicrobiales bacterium]|nr:MAG: hypothetical protein DLM55_04560 [Acidimicrobiales bacterium]